MYRSAFTFTIVILSPWLLILLANSQDPNNNMLATFELGFLGVSAGIGVARHLLAKPGYPLAIFSQGSGWPMSVGQSAVSTLPRLEFGEFADNLAALVILLRCLSKGQVVESYTELLRLREHISLRGDPKSVAWLLPAIDGAIGKKR